MPEYITYFKSDEGVCRDNFNSRIEQINSEFEKIEVSKGSVGGIAALDGNGKLAQMPSASDVGAVSKSGDSMNGDLSIGKLYPTITLNDSGGKGAQTFIQNANHITWITTRNDIDNGDNYRGIIVGDSESYEYLKNAVKVENL